MFEQYQYLIDTHTGVGYAAFKKAQADGLRGPVLLIATAHPFKFADLIPALNPIIQQKSPGHMREIFERQEIFDVTK